MVPFQTTQGSPYYGLKLIGKKAVSEILLKFRCPLITLGKFYLEFLYEIKKYISCVLHPLET
jgi:hypothetical protein